MAMHQTLMSFRHDPDGVRGRRVERELLKRVLSMARPYRRQLIGFLIAVIVAAVVTAIPALLLKTLLDTAVPDKDLTLLTVLAIGAVLLAFASAGLSLLYFQFQPDGSKKIVFPATVAEGATYAKPAGAP